MSNTQHEMAQALAEKSWIEDRLNEVRVRNKQGIPLKVEVRNEQGLWEEARDE